MRKLLKAFCSIIFLIVSFVVFILSMSLGGFFIDFYGSEYLKDLILYSPNGLVVFAVIITAFVYFILKKVLNV